VKVLIVMVSLCALAQCRAQTQPELSPRASLSAGMGVEYASYADVTTLINATVAPAQVVPRFKTAVEFFGAGTMPLVEPWLLKFEYAYTLATFSPQGAYGPATINVIYQMPSLILQYMLLDRGVYSVRLGAGGGYHFGRLEENTLYFSDAFTGKGPGMVVEIEANTAFGDHLYAYLGANARWELVGTVVDARGASPGVASSGSPVTFHSFGAGARLGACYLF